MKTAVSSQTKKKNLVEPKTRFGFVKNQKKNKKEKQGKTNKSNKRMRKTRFYSIYISKSKKGF